MKLTVTIVHEIERCYQSCPYFGVDGGPSGAMVCHHPKAPNYGYIIGHPECDTGFPQQCPLVNEQQAAPERCTVCCCDCLPCQSCDHK